MGDVALERGDGAAGRFVAPEFLDEEFGGHHAAQADEQQGEQGPAAWWAQWQLTPVVSRRHGPQNVQ